MHHYVLCQFRTNTTFTGIKLLSLYTHVNHLTFVWSRLPSVGWFSPSPSPPPSAAVHYLYILFVFHRVTTLKNMPQSLQQPAMFCFAVLRSHLHAGFICNNSLTEPFVSEERFSLFLRTGNPVLLHGNETRYWWIKGRQDNAPEIQ